MERARIVDDDERHTRSVAKVELLCLRGECIERRASLRIILTPVGEDILCEYAPVSADFPERERTGLEQLDQERARYVEEIGGLLSGQFSVNRHDGNSVAVRHLAQDLKQQFERLPRQGNRIRFARAPEHNVLNLATIFGKRGELSKSHLRLVGGLRRRDFLRGRHCTEEAASSGLSDSGYSTDRNVVSKRNKRNKRNRRKGGPPRSGSR